MGAAFDTSGYVQCPAPDQKPNESTGCWFWHTLSPFTQGYVEALFAAGPAGDCWRNQLSRARPERLRSSTPRDRIVGFSDLAPETLARIIADCASFTAPLMGSASVTNDGGRVFWLNRQAQQCPGFPPLTVQLGDDGKVRFAKARILPQTEKGSTTPPVKTGEG